MKERIRQRIDLVRHESIEPSLTSGTEVIQNKAKSTIEVDHFRHETIDLVLPSEFRGGKDPRGILTTKIMYRNYSKEDSHSNLRKHEIDHDLNDVQN